MLFKYLQFELSHKIGMLHINRSEFLNALNSKMFDELETLILEIKNKKNISVLIITGVGKSFVAGADIKEMSQFNAKQAEVFSKKGQKVFNLIETLAIPVIAAVNGFALGGGLELALSCDILLFSDKAKVGLPEVSLGLIPAFGGTQRLIRAVGLYKAKEIIFSGNIYSAQEALSKGLGNQVIAHEELIKKAYTLAKEIQKRGPIGIQKAKQLIHVQDKLTLEARLQKEAKEFSELFKSSDAKEGIQAFLEKREPEFNSQ